MLLEHAKAGFAQNVALKFLVYFRTKSYKILVLFEDLDHDKAVMKQSVALFLHKHQRTDIDLQIKGLPLLFVWTHCVRRILTLSPRQ